MVETAVNVKSVSNRKNKITTLKIQYSDNVTNVKSLIAETVSYCVADYNSRRESSDLISVLTPTLIDDKAESGKISFGVNYGEKNAELSKAASYALEAFEDGIVVIFADDRKLENLNDKLDLNKIKSLTFIKLTMLAGRMW